MQAACRPRAASSTAVPRLLPPHRQAESGACARARLSLLRHAGPEGNARPRRLQLREHTAVSTCLHAPLVRSGPRHRTPLSARGALAFITSSAHDTSAAPAHRNRVLASRGHAPPRAKKTGTTIVGVIYNVRPAAAAPAAAAPRDPCCIAHTPHTPPPRLVPRARAGGGGARRGHSRDRGRHRRRQGVREDPLHCRQHLVLRCGHVGRHGEHDAQRVVSARAASAGDGEAAPRGDRVHHAEADALPLPGPRLRRARPRRRRLQRPVSLYGLPARLD